MSQITRRAITLRKVALSNRPYSFTKSIASYSTDAKSPYNQDAKASQKTIGDDKSITHDQQTESTSEKELSPEEKKAQAAQLAMQSIKDIGSLLSSAPDEATQPIDTQPIFEDPKLFGGLSLLHQGQVLQELQEKFDSKWTKLSLKDKQLGYYIAYGDWGVREDFKNWQTSEPPYDLPFRTPSRVKTINPTPKTIIKQLEPVILSETPVREKQFDIKKMDGITKFFIYLTVFISIVAISRDKRTGEEGKPVETIIDDPYERERQLRQEREKQEEELRIQAELERQRQRKWYYLWLK